MNTQIWKNPSDNRWYLVEVTVICEVTFVTPVSGDGHLTSEGARFEQAQILFENSITKQT